MVERHTRLVNGLISGTFALGIPLAFKQISGGQFGPVGWYLVSLGQISGFFSEEGNVEKWISGPLACMLRVRYTIVKFGNNVFF